MCFAIMICRRKRHGLLDGCPFVVIRHGQMVLGMTYIALYYNPIYQLRTSRIRNCCWLSGKVVRNILFLFLFQKQFCILAVHLFRIRPNMIIYFCQLIRTIVVKIASFHQQPFRLFTDFFYCLPLCLELGVQKCACNKNSQGEILILPLFMLEIF